MQPAPLVSLVAYPSLQLVVTLDRQGLITGWKAETGSEWASFRLPTFCSSMEACGHPEGPFLMVSDPALRSPSGPNHLLVKATMVGGVWIPLHSRPCLSGSSLPTTGNAGSAVLQTSAQPKPVSAASPAVWSSYGFVATWPCFLLYAAFLTTVILSWLLTVRGGHIL